MAAHAASIEEQRSLFQGFVALAHEMGAKKVRSGETCVIDDGASRSVVFLFSHDDFPGTRFGYHCKPPADDPYEEIWLAEELATGALHRMMRYDEPTADEGGIMWTRLYGQLLGSADESAEPALPLRAFAHVEATETGATCGIYVAGESKSAPHACRGAAVAKVSATTFDRAVLDKLGRPVQHLIGLYVGACDDHVEGLQRRTDRLDGQVEILPVEDR